MSGSAVLTGTEHCAAQEGIDPWEQQVSQSLPLLRVWPSHAWVIASPILLDPSVAAYVSAGPCGEWTESMRWRAGGGAW